MSTSIKDVKFNILVLSNSSFEFEKFLQGVESLKKLNMTIYSKEDYNNSKIDLSDVNMVVFTGGEDVHPEFYSELQGKYTSINKDRDVFEHKIFRSLGKNVLKVGICRGAQFLNVMSGGRLIQHVNGHTTSHDITTVEGLNLNITSTHHQMMYPYDVKHHTLIAWSKYFRSETYLDGRNEEHEIPINFLEPEIVHFTNTNSLCIQGHPEYDSCSEETVTYCQDLISNLININE